MQPTKSAAKSMTLQGWALLLVPFVAQLASKFGIDTSIGELTEIIEAFAYTAGLCLVLWGRIRVGDLRIPGKTTTAWLLMATVVFAGGCQAVNPDLSSGQQMDVYTRSYALACDAMRQAMAADLVSLSTVEAFEAQRIKAKAAIDAGWAAVKAGHDAETAMALTLCEQAIADLKQLTPGKVPEKDQAT